MSEKKSKPYIANLVLKSDVYNLNSITTDATVENKFQICLTKLNSFATRGIALNDIKILIALNKNNQKILRHYISSLKINPKSQNISNISKEAQAIIYGIISKEYCYNLYDPIDKPPNLVKTIERMLTQLREGYLLSNEQIQNAVADSFINILIYSMPKEDISLIILIFFEPLIKVMNSGENLIIQQGAALVIFKLLDFLSKKGEICFDKETIDKILEIISKNYLNNFLKGCPLDNHYAIENLYQLMILVKFDVFNERLKELYSKLINYLKYKEFNYQLKISVLKLFELIADNLLSSDTDKIIGYFQEDILIALNEKISDRIHKVQVKAREALNKWKKLEIIFLNEERHKENYLLDNEEENNYKRDDNNYKDNNKIISNNNRYFFHNNDKKDMNINENKNFNNLDLNKLNNTKNKHLNNIDDKNNHQLLKKSLSKIISESLSKTQAYINNNISSKLDQMEAKINELQKKIIMFKRNKDKLSNGNKKSNKNLESEINKIWLDCLKLVEQNKLSEAYDLILSAGDDLYLLRLACLTGPVLHLLDENLAKKVLIRINKINRGKQISDILIKFIEESIGNNNIFSKLEYQEQNDILDSLFLIFKNKKNNELTIKAQNLYYLIIEESNKNQNV